MELIVTNVITNCHSQAPKAKLGKALLSVYASATANTTAATATVTVTGSLQQIALKQDHGFQAS